jgi:hypothetical protein
MTAIRVSSIRSVVTVAGSSSRCRSMPRISAVQSVSISSTGRTNSTPARSARSSTARMITVLPRALCSIKASLNRSSDAATAQASAAVGIVAHHDPHEFADEGIEPRRGGADARVTCQSLLHARTAHGQEQVGLAVEVRVNGPFRHPGGEGDLLERRRVKAVLEKDPAGALDQPGAGARFLRLAGQPDDSHTVGI